MIPLHEVLRQGRRHRNKAAIVDRRPNSENPAYKNVGVQGVKEMKAEDGKLGGGNTQTIKKIPMYGVFQSRVGGDLIRGEVS